MQWTEPVGIIRMVRELALRRPRPLIGINVMSAMNAEHDWRCVECGEAVPADFDVCWNCGADRSGTPDASFRRAVGFTPQCKACGYLLHGLPSRICPECGTPFDPTEKDTIRDIPEAT